MGESVKIVESNLYITKGECQSVEGSYNIIDSEAGYLHIVGNGVSEKNRSNAYTLTKDGTGWFKNGIKIGGNGQYDEEAKKLATEDYVNSEIEKIKNSDSDNDNYLSNYFKLIPEGKTIDDLNTFDDLGTYLNPTLPFDVTDEIEDILEAVNQSTLSVTMGYVMIKDEETEELIPTSALYQTITTYPGQTPEIKQRYAFINEESGISSDWSEWKVVSAFNIQDGIVDGSIQSVNSDAGSKVFRFNLEHEYTNEDKSNKRYYLTYVVDEMKDKQFTLVLTSNYDFYGTITNVVHTEGNAGYITVDNYVEPNTNSSTKIWEGSYILLPYDYMDSSDSYTWNNQFVNKGSHLLGNDIEGAGGVAFGEDTHAMGIGSFATGYQQIAAGKYAATFGRYNVAAYCDFAAGQNMKLLGHWNAGFGRDNYIANTSDYSIAAGLRNEIYKSHCSAFGRGHVLKMDDASARGRYSEIDNAYRYIDKVGYGDGQKSDGTIDRKNIYTLDKEGNAWFKGNIKFGGTNYDNANEMFTVKEYSTLNEILSTPALLGTVVQVPYMVASYPKSNNADYDLVLYDTIAGDSSYSIETFNGREAIKIGTKYAYFNVEELSSTPVNDYELKITYFDDGNNTRIRIWYLTETGNGEAYVDIYRTNTQQWKTSTVQLKGMKFKAESKYQRINDLRITTVGQDAYISNIELYNGKNLYILNNSDYTSVSNWSKIGVGTDNEPTLSWREINESDINSALEPGCYIVKEISGDITVYNLLIVSKYIVTDSGISKNEICQTMINSNGIIFRRTIKDDIYSNWINIMDKNYNKTYSYNNISNLPNMSYAKIGDTAICNSVISSIKLGDNEIGNHLTAYHPTNEEEYGYNVNSTIGGRDCCKSGYLYNELKDVPAVSSNRYQKMLHFSLPDLDNTNTNLYNVAIKVSYYDIDESLTTHITKYINLEHTSSKTYTSVATIQNTQEWKEAFVVIPNMLLNKGFSYQDFRLVCSSDLSMYISDVSLYISEKEAKDTGLNRSINKEVYMLTDDDYTNLENWVKISK